MRYNYSVDVMVRIIQTSIEAYISLPDMDERPSEKGYEPYENIVSLGDIG
jgi:hypothetical protein